MLLRLTGYTVACAHDGYEALEQFDRGHPDLVVLDIDLPGLDGLEVARQIRSRPGGGDVVLVALTGWGNDTDRLHSAEAGFDHHLVKPVEFDALEAIFGGLIPSC